MTAVVAMLLSATLMSPLRGANAPIGPSLTQQPKSETATDFYLRYRKTATAAKSVDEILAFWNSQLLHEYNMEPDDVKAGTLGMVKRMESSLTDVRVLKESATASGATLLLEAIGPDKKPMTGSVDLVKENGAWKLVEAEQWKPKS
jgi:hypothetical protein